MLESIFTLGAIVSDQRFAGAQYILEIDEMLEKLESSDLTLESELIRLRSEICSYYSLSQKPKKLKIWEIAELADLMSLYRYQYYWLCKSTHPTALGSITGESGGTLGFRSTTLVFVLSAALAFLDQVVKTHEPQKRIDKATNILGHIESSLEDNEARELDKLESNYKAELSEYLHNQLKNEKS